MTTVLTVLTGQRNRKTEDEVEIILTKSENSLHTLKHTIMCVGESAFQLEKYNVLAFQMPSTPPARSECMGLH